MCDIFFCNSWPETSQDAYRTRRPITERLVDVRYQHQAVLKGRGARPQVLKGEAPGLEPIDFERLVDVRYLLL